MEKAVNAIAAVAKGTSVEISALLYATVVAGSRLIYQQLLLEKCCVYQLNYSKDVCDNLDAHTDAEDDSQRLAARYNMYDTLMEYIIPVFVAIFVGHWTDKHGRKPLIVFCFFAAMAQQIGMLVNVAYMSWDPIYISVFSSLPMSFGAFTTFLLLIFSYLADVTTPEQRTVRLSILNLFLYSGQPLGNLVGAQIYESYGYEAAFYFFIAISLVGGIYSAWKLKSRNQLSSNTEDAKISRREKLSQFLNIRESVTETFKAFFRRREHNHRLVLIAIGITLLIGLFPIYGEFSVDFLYLKKRMSWSVKQISYYSTFKTSLQIIGAVIFTPIFKIVLRWEDTKIGGVSVCLQTLSRLTYSFATTTWMFYASGVLYMLSTVKAAVARSIISKVVEPQELGKCYAVIGFSEAVVPIVAGILYSEVYRATVSFFPGAVFLISTGCWLAASFLYLLVHFKFFEEDLVHGKRDGKDSESVFLSKLRAKSQLRCNPGWMLAVQVIATCRNPAAATELNEVLKNNGLHEAIKLDVHDHESIKEAFAVVKDVAPKLDILINNAGVASKNHPIDPVTSADPDEMLRLYEVNVIGPMMVIQTFLPILDTKTRGRFPMVANLSSLLGSLSANSAGGITSYRCSKASLNMLTKNLSVEAPWITFVAVHPGWVQTDMGSANNRKPPVTTSESASGIMKLLTEFKHENSGRLFDWNGLEISP
ncbi:unnamed protein product [Notodromas monacha]|uniref:Uncharacterized protein n=1 Tax=Notodromas monacha TaxID=399045 RepID=A0A7R9G7N5_9CRUS|nr:unnamed protein product [Notodromas monacha]CAG0912246.1 unnamed protein product [Notodromas monacha]